MAHTDPPSVFEVQPDPVTLLDAVNRLSNNVVTLTATVNVSGRIAGRARIASYLAILAVVLIAVVGSFGLLRLNAAVEDNRANAVQACENANDSRAANLALWNFVLQISSADDPTPNPELPALQKWIGQLFAKHDCSDLGRQYVIPPPPVFNNNG